VESGVGVGLGGWLGLTELGRKGTEVKEFADARHCWVKGTNRKKTKEQNVKGYARTKGGSWGDAI